MSPPEYPRCDNLLSLITRTRLGHKSDTSKDGHKRQILICLPGPDPPQLMRRDADSKDRRLIDAWIDVLYSQKVMELETNLQASDSWIYLTCGQSVGHQPYLTSDSELFFWVQQRFFQSGDFMKREVDHSGDHYSDRSQLRHGTYCTRLSTLTQRWYRTSDDKSAAHSLAVYYL